jgi:hypothetical protein
MDRYTYSLVFAADMYSTVFKSDPLDPARGDRYRRSILLPGGSREELDSLEVKEVILSIDIETHLFLGIPRTPPKSRCIFGGNIREFVDDDIPRIPHLIDALYRRKEVPLFFYAR